MYLAQDVRVLNNLVTRADHQLSSGFHQHRSPCTVEALQEGMKTIMRTTVHKEANIVEMREKEVGLDMTECANMVVSEATHEAEAVV